MISLQSLSINFKDGPKELKVLYNLTLNINAGEIVSILGPSGCGKSTLLRCIAGLISPTSGKVDIEGFADLNEVYREKKIGMAFQEPFLLNWRTISSNIKLPFEIGNKTQITDDQASRVDWLVSVSGLKEWLNAYPSQLSVGMRQRVSLIRALVNNPSLVLLDEPFSALDDFTRLSLSEEIHTLLREQQKTTILVTHNIEEAFYFADKVVVLSPRPASIIKIYTVNRKRESEGSLLNDPLFQQEVADCKKFILSGNLKTYE